MNVPRFKFLQNLTLFEAYYFLYLPTLCHHSVKTIHKPACHQNCSEPLQKLEEHT